MAAIDTRTTGRRTKAEPLTASVSSTRDEAPCVEPPMTPHHASATPSWHSHFIGLHLWRGGAFLAATPRSAREAIIVRSISISSCRRCGVVAHSIKLVVALRKRISRHHRRRLAVTALLSRYSGDGLFRARPMCLYGH